MMVDIQVNSQGSFYNPDRVRILVVVRMVMAVVISKVVEVLMVVEIQFDGNLKEASTILAG